MTFYDVAALYRQQQVLVRYKTVTQALS